MKRRCVFLDRDGTVNVAPPPGDYILNAEQFRLLPGIIDWIRIFNRLGYLVIIVTNQRGVARGLMSQQDLDEIHRVMMQEIERGGWRIDQIFTCPHDEGVCSCRKPKTGLVLEAQKHWEIDLAESVLFGDADSDRELAIRCGMGFIRVRDGHVAEDNL